MMPEHPADLELNLPGNFEELCHTASTFDLIKAVQEENPSVDPARIATLFSEPRVDCQEEDL
jgi:hypothetical protein